MYEGKHIGVVVPAYNESELVETAVARVPEYVDRIYVVDDDSTDDTWKHICQAATNRNSHGRSDLAADGGISVVEQRQVVPIQHEHNRGVGGAIKTGYKRALTDGMDVTAVMAGDDQMDPSHLSNLLDPLTKGQADYAKGNRLLYPEHRASMSSWRLFGNSLLSLLTKIASGYWKTMDPQNGYTAISREALEAVDLDDLYEDYGFANELLVRLNVHDMRVADVAVPAVYGEETSHISYSTFVPLLSSVLLSKFCWRLRRKYLLLDFHPLALLYIQGAVASGVGVLVGLFAAVVAVTGGPLVTSGAAAALLFAIGSFALVQAMTYDMHENEHLEVRTT